MKRVLLLLLALAACGGCRSPELTSNLLFGLFRDAYTDTGGSDAEKQRHFNQQREAWEAHAASGGFSSGE